MKCRVHYVSPKGSAEMVAEAIARECKCVKEPLLPAYMPEGVALLFLGVEGKADKVTMEFINSMSKERISNVALFFCGKDGSSAFQTMREAFKNRGVNVLDKTLTAPCKAMFHAGPTDSDMQAAKKFAEECIALVTKE